MPGGGEKASGSEVYYRARKRPGDAVDALDAGDDELAELVDVSGLGPHDDVVGAGDVLGGVTPQVGDRAATSAALPTSVWMRM